MDSTSTTTTTTASTNKWDDALFRTSYAWTQFLESTAHYEIPQGRSTDLVSTPLHSLSHFQIRHSCFVEDINNAPRDPTNDEAIPEYPTPEAIQADPEALNRYKGAMDNYKVRIANWRDWRSLRTTARTEWEQHCRDHGAACRYVISKLPDRIMSHVDADIRSGRINLRCVHTLANRITQIIIGQAPHQEAANLLDLDRMKRHHMAKPVDWTCRTSIEKFAIGLTSLHLTYQRSVKQCQQACLDNVAANCREMCGIHHPLNRISIDLNLHIINKLRSDERKLPFSMLKGLEDLNRSDLCHDAFKTIIGLMHEHAGQIKTNPDSGEITKDSKNKGLRTKGSGKQGANSNPPETDRSPSTSTTTPKGRVKVDVTKFDAAKWGAFCPIHLKKDANGNPTSTHKAYDCIVLLKEAQEAGCVPSGKEDAALSAANGTSKFSKRKNQSKHDGSPAKKHKGLRVKTDLHMDENEIAFRKMILDANNGEITNKDSDSLGNIPMNVDNYFPVSPSYEKVLNIKTSSKLSNHEAVGDTGATIHLTNDESILSNLRPFSGTNPLVYTASGETMHISKVGDINILFGGNKRTISNVNLVPECSETLISIGKMLKQFQNSGIIINSDGMYNISLLREDVKNIIKNSVKFAEFRDGTYYLSLDRAVDSDSVSRASNVVEASKSKRKRNSTRPKGVLGRSESDGIDGVLPIWSFWHRCLSHRNLEAFESLLSQDKMFLGKRDLLKKVLKIKNECVICNMGKQVHIVPLPAEYSPHRILETICIDSVPLTCPSFSGYKHYLAIMDLWSRYLTIVPVFNKSQGEMGTNLINTLKQFRVQHKTDIVNVRTDAGTELVNRSVKAYLAEIGAVLKPAPSQGQSFNGSVERRIGIIKDGARCDLLNAHLPIDFYLEAIQNSAKISNYAIHSAINDIPIRRWSQCDPDLDRLRYPFGCLVTVYEAKEVRDQRGQKAEPGIFLGTQGTKLFIVFTYATQRITVEHDVRFFINKFPGAKRVNGKLVPCMNLADPVKQRPDPDLANEIRLEFESAWQKSTLFNDTRSPTISHELASGLLENTNINNGHEKSVTFNDLPIMTKPTSSTLIGNETAEAALEPSQGQNSGRGSEKSILPDPDSDTTRNDLVTPASSLRESAQLEAADLQPGALVSDTIPDSSHVQNREGTLSEDRESNEDAHDMEENEAPLKVVDALAPSGAKTFDFDDMTYLDKDDGTVLSRLSRVSDKPYSPLQFIVPDYIEWYDENLQPVARRASKAPKKSPINLWNYKGPGSKPTKPILLSECPPEPTRFDKVFGHPFEDMFKSGMVEEIKALQDLGVYVEGPVPEGARVIGSTWTYKNKGEGARLVRCKARFCAQGFSEIKNVDYSPQYVYSPVVKGASTRVIVAMRGGDVISTLDVSNAFLQGDLDEEKYLKCPKGFPPKDPSHVWHLKKPLYGLHTSSKQWHLKLKGFLIGIGFNPTKNDPCVFTRNRPREPCDIIFVHVDDNVMISKSKAIINEIKAEFRKVFKVTDTEEAENVLGLQIYKIKGGTYLGQPVYAKKILDDSGFWSKEGKLNPMSPTWKPDSSELLTGEERDFFVSYNMRLSWMAINTRPDISFTVNTLSQRMQNPNKGDLKALHHLLRYLKQTWDLGLYYQTDRMKDIEMVTNDDCNDIISHHEQQGVKDKLVGYSDAGFGGEQGYFSRTGWLYMVGGCVATWCTKKQSMVALSSTEAETYALSEATKEAIFLKEFCKEIGELNDDTPPIKIYEDNTSCIAIVTNPIAHARSKHFAVRSAFIRDMIDNKKIEIIWCPTDLMIADILTKALDPNLHQKLTHLMGLRSLAKLRELEDSQGKQ